MLGITYVSLILGELAPKQLALNAPERIASLLARPLRLLSKVSSPAVSFLDGSTRLILKLLGTRDRFRIGSGTGSAVRCGLS